MLRFIHAAAAVLLVLALPACGHQVTGLGKTQSLVPSGEMEIIFGTQAPINTQLYSYLIVINTSGDQEPYWIGSSSNYEDWTFVMQIGGASPGFLGGVSAVSTPQLYQVITDPQEGVGYLGYHVAAVPLSVFNVNTSFGGGAFTNGFAVTFNRCLLDRNNPLTSTPAANTGTDCPPYSYINENWAINIFTVDATGAPNDSLDDNGATGTSVQFYVDTALQINGKVDIKGIIAPLSNPAGEIAGIEVFSQP
jgi:hypothetical protein